MHENSKSIWLFTQKEMSIKYKSKVASSMHVAEDYVFRQVVVNVSRSHQCF